MGGQNSLVLAMGSKEVALMSRHQETLDRALSNLKRYASDLERHGLLLGGSKDEVLSRVWTTTSLEETPS